MQKLKYFHSRTLHLVR
uniref:Uncharacterized protein n=1 Tax=Vitis vinifera TaxID=29760 RepID=F6H3I0_VITVI